MRAMPESCWRMSSEMKPPRMKKSSVKFVRKVWTREISTARPDATPYCESRYMRTANPESPALVTT